MIVTSKGMLNIQGLSALVGEPIHYYLDPRTKLTSQSTVAGWGRKKSFTLAQEFVQKKGGQCLCLEDGFIRSLGLGKDGSPALSIVMDWQGIYFDATQQSDLENLIAAEENKQKNQRAEKAIGKILKHKITKYNQVGHALPQQDFLTQKNILVVDQTFGDQSIRYSGATKHSFQNMLKQALSDHPHATIWVKTHPDVIAAKAKGHFSVKQLQHPRIRLCTQAYNPIELLQYMDEVYVVSSQMGFEALLCQKKVHCFGVPWYAGWGLTNDTHAPLQILQQRRQIHRSLEHVFACAYFDYARYVSPVTQQRCELEDILRLLVPNLQFQAKLSEQIYCYGFSRWKKGFMTDFMQFSKKNLHFRSWFKPQPQAQVIAWGKKARNFKQKGYASVITVEDGFVRSRGLGAELTRPYSLVFDDVGIYYDATQASRLEKNLNHIQLDCDEQIRAADLIQLLLMLNITKYNVGVRKALKRPDESRTVVLVVGQVEDDLSIQLGGKHIKRNLDLLQEVRRIRPDAYIIYKPHPDVQAGLRLGKIENNQVFLYADQMEIDASITECFDIIDEIHTISSLSGFEALLRGIRVYCYGLPFYAGWGLTQDQHRCERRNRQLSLEELVYGVLIDYAYYNLPQTRRYQLPLVNIEDVIARLNDEREKGQSSPVLKSVFAKLRATIMYKVQNK